MRPHQKACDFAPENLQVAGIACYPEDESICMRRYVIFGPLPSWESWLAEHPVYTARLSNCQRSTRYLRATLTIKIAWVELEERRELFWKTEELWAQTTEWLWRHETSANRWSFYCFWAEL